MHVGDLKRVSACVFDAYGTLFDFASAAAACEAAPVERRAALTALWRDKQLQYAWLRSLQGRYVDFWTVTGDALDYALDSLGLADTGLRDPLMALYRRLSAFPEVPATLSALRGAGYATAILSNGSPDMLADAVAAAGLGGLFDVVLSVDPLRTFKTDPRVYQYALDRLGVAAGEVAFLSSNGWDAYAASDFGLSAVWCNRHRQPRERLPGAPEFEIRSLSELPPLLGLRA
jgi:2-haloacid dehalogenase